MSIAIVTPDNDLFDVLSEQLALASIPCVRQGESDRLGAGRIAVVDGLDEARKLRQRNPGAHLVALLERDELTQCDELFAELAVKPMNPVEMRLRILSLERRLSEGDVHAHLLAEAVEQTGDIMEITNPKAILQYVNPAFTKILGYQKEEVLGKTPAQLVRSDRHTPEYFRNIDATLSAGKVWTGLLISRSRDGRVVHLESTISPISNARGEITHHVSVKRDISERILREEALQETNRALAQARDAALAASRSKSEFLANMSHELRTPLNAIIGYSELLMEDAEEDERASLRADLGKIRDAGAHLLDLINDVLDISKVEAGKMELHIEEFDLNEVMNSVVSTIRPLAEKNRNDFSLVWSSAAPTLPMRADRRKLKQILMNLLSNACRFTEAGQVTLDVSLVDVDDRVHAVFAVRDTGIGISQEQRQKIFRPFTQADSSTTRKYGGTGLGLTISRHFCELMGGSIDLESEAGKGSTFTARVPLRMSTNKARPSSLPRGVQRILVIDDDRSTCELLQQTLGQHGYEVLTANRGVDGLTMARELRPSLIVLDVVIPDMDGFSVLTALKLDVETESIPVVMLTLQEQSEIGLTLGAVDYFVKPVEPKKLLGAIHRHMRMEDGPLTVLVVEDDGPTRELMQRTIEGAGHLVLSAENGRLALRLLDGAYRIHLVVLDLMMPEMDGFQFLEHLRAHPNYGDVPVVVATAKVLTEAERNTLQKSTRRIIEKNAYSRSELLKLVETQVTRILSEPPPPPAPSE
jgi:PAS domain S-box-containing protein